jgi:hypothetical protein
VTALFVNPGLDGQRLMVSVVEDDVDGMENADVTMTIVISVDDDGRVTVAANGPLEVVEL